MEGPEKRLLELVSDYRKACTEVTKLEEEFDSVVMNANSDNVEDYIELATQRMFVGEDMMKEARGRLFNFLDEYFSDETD